MFKLMVISGPARGASYSVHDGENRIGRVEGNDIVLSSQKVSKSHCVLVVNNSEIIVRDAGSSNGTFVNGILTKQKKVAPGDKISVGDFVFELVQIKASTQVSVPIPQNVIPFPSQQSFQIPQTPQQIPLAQSHQVPISLKDKLKHFFETYVINFLYSTNEKQEWRSVSIGLLVGFTLLATAVSVYPVLDRVELKLEQESIYRASFLARQIADRNSAHIFEKLESKVDVGFAEREPGVLNAYVVDVEGRVIAPARDLNQYLTEPSKASFSAVARQFYQNQDRTSRFSRTYGEVLAVAEPIRIFNPAEGKNSTVALAMVFFDRSLILFDSGTLALAYIQSFILIAILSVIIFFCLYKLTLKPLTHLNTEIDQSLKNRSSTIARKYKMEEISPLFDVISAALQRAASSAEGGGGTGQEALSEEAIETIKFLSDKAFGLGVLLFGADRRILHLNPTMEEITGIRKDSARGSDIGNSARDAAFVSFVEDILTRSQSTVGSVSEDFEFSGTNYKLECVAVGAPVLVKLYVLTAHTMGTGAS